MNILNKKSVNVLMGTENQKAQDEGFRLGTKDIPPQIIKPRHLESSPDSAGSLYYSDGTSFARLAPGEAGQMLSMEDSTPTWTTVTPPVIPSYSWASWVPTWPTGFSVAPGIQSARYIVIDKIVYYYLVCSSNGTSDANTVTVSLPLTIATTIAGGVVGYGVNNGTILTTMMGGVYVGGTTTLQLAPTLAQNYTGWTPTGSKSANIQGFYEIA